MIDDYAIAERVEHFLRSINHIDKWMELEDVAEAVRLSEEEIYMTCREFNQFKVTPEHIKLWH